MDADGKLGPPVSPERTLHLGVPEDFTAAKDLLARAGGGGAGPGPGPGQRRGLAHDGHLAVSVGRPPGDAPWWLMLAAPADERGVAVPLAERRQLAAVIVEAERLLARAGMIVTGPAASHCRRLSQRSSFLICRKGAARPLKTPAFSAPE